MKKIVALLMIVAICCVSLVSCDMLIGVGAKLGVWPRSADELLEKVEDNMDSLTSYECDLEGTIKANAYGYYVEGYVTGKDVFINKDGNAYYYYSEVNTESSVKELRVTENYTVAVEYDDGKMFYWNSEPTPNKKFFCVTDVERFKEYIDEESEIDAELDECVNKSFKKNDDGTWELELSGYTSAAVLEISEAMGYAEGTFSDKVVDIDVKMVINSDLLVKKMTMDFVFEESESDENTPEVSMSLIYSSYNDAEKESDKINESECIRVADLITLLKVDKTIKEKYTEDNGEFTLNIEQSILDQKFTENDNVKYGVKNGKYYYEIDVTSNTLPTSSIKYENGTLSVDGESVAQTEDAARLQINQLLSSTGYDVTLIKSMEKVSDGVYKFSADVADPSLYKTLLSSIGATAISVEDNYITVTVGDDGVESIVSSIRAKGVAYVSGVLGEIVFRSVTTLTFDTDDDGTSGADSNGSI